MPPRTNDGSSGARAKAGADHSVMRELNRSLVLQLIKDRGPVSRAEVAKTADLAKPTVSGIVDDLIEAGLVRDVGLGRTPTGEGRPPMLVEFNARSQYVVGVHIGVQRTNIVVADAVGREVGRARRPTPSRKPETALRQIARSVHAALADADVPLTNLASVGVCVPGLVDMRDGTCLLAPNLGWRDVAVAAILDSEIGVPVAVHNTAQAAVVAERIDGAAQGADEVVLLYAGTGVGAGILSNGRLLHGVRGIAGEIGHCRIPAATEACTCGKVGCVETVAAARAVARAARVAARDDGGALPDSEEITPEAVAAAAAAGDHVSRVVLADAGRALGIAASWLVNLFNPEVLVVGGGLAGAGEPLLGPLRETVAAETLSRARLDVDIRTWALGQEAKVRGAVLVALQQSESYYRVIFQGGS